MKKTNPTGEAYLFLGLTLGLSWLVFWGPLALFQVPTISFVNKTTGPVWAIIVYILGGFVPSLTALVLTGVREGKPGLGRLIRSAFQVKIGLRWYAIILGVVLVGAAGQILANSLLGHSFDFSLFLAQLGSFLPLLILGPLSEELGWRGYALDRLQTRWNALVSSLVVGVTWGLWHLPLFFMVGTSQHELKLPFIGFLIGLTAESVLYTWIYNASRRNLWSAIFFHWIYTYFAQVISTGVTRSPLYNVIEFLPYLLMALLVALFALRPQGLHTSPSGPGHGVARARQ